MLVVLASFLSLILSVSASHFEPLAFELSASDSDSGYQVWRVSSPSLSEFPLSKVFTRAFQREYYSTCFDEKTKVVCVPPLPMETLKGECIRAYDACAPTNRLCIQSCALDAL